MWLSSGPSSTVAMDGPGSSLSALGSTGMPGGDEVRLFRPSQGYWLRGAGSCSGTFHTTVAVSLWACSLLLCSGVSCLIPRQSITVGARVVDSNRPRPLASHPPTTISEVLGADRTLNGLRPGTSELWAVPFSPRSPSPFSDLSLPFSPPPSSATGACPLIFVPTSLPSIPPGPRVLFPYSWSGLQFIGIRLRTRPLSRYALVSCRMFLQNPSVRTSRQGPPTRHSF